jgi:integrase
LRERNHGSWYFHCSVVDLWGRRERVRRGGFVSKAAAVRARDEVLAQGYPETMGRTWTVARWLRYWLASRVSVRANTVRFYTQHVDRYLIPHLGHVKVGELTGRHITGMFTTLRTTSSRHGRPIAGTTLHHIRATLRAALNAALRDGVITDNPARRVELPAARRPHAQVWTERLVEQWRATGEHPVVAVWTPAQVAEFLGHTRTDRLHAMWWLIALRGLRRGEAAGLRWADVDLHRREVTITRQLTTCGSRLVVSEPKSAASRRTIALDRTTVQVLRDHQRRQHAERQAAGHQWIDTGHVFTRPDGAPLKPDYLSQRFRLLVRRSGLPPVRLHDLRHGAASLAHTAGADLKLIQAQLGHASIVLTADTYTSVLPAAHRKAAEATARLILATARTTRTTITSRYSRANGKTPHRPAPSPDNGTRPPTASTAPAPRRRSTTQAQKPRQRHRR